MEVNEIRQRLEQELRSTGSRLREQGGPLDPRQLNERTMRAFYPEPPARIDEPDDD